MNNKLEKIVIDAILGQKPSVTLPTDTESQDVKKVIRIFMRSHPEVFWFSNQYHWNDSKGILSLKYNFTPSKKKFFEEEIANAVKYLFQPDELAHLSELDKVGYVYKWIASNSSYNEYSSFNQTIYSVLINRNSVCTGYAKTAQYLLSLLGVESRLIFGKLLYDQSKSGRHCWNIVKIDGEWYHVDFCFADLTLIGLLNFDEVSLEQDGILWNYFGVSTDQILLNRTIEDVESYPMCNKIIERRPGISLLPPLKQLAVCKSDSGFFAKIFLDSFDKKSVIKIEREGHKLTNNEYALLSRLEGCKHIVKLKGLYEDGIRLEQLVPWSEMLNSHYYYPDESQLRKILIQLVKGLIEISEKGISYSDIHYNNIFIDNEGTYKWGDFGLAFDTTDDWALPADLIGSDGIPLGSRWFMSPESFYHGSFTEKSAIYSLGMIAYFVMNDMRPPFCSDSEHQNEALSDRLSGKPIPNPVFDEKYPLLWSLISSVLSFSAIDRPHSYKDFLMQLESSDFVLDEVATDPTDFRFVDTDVYNDMEIGVSTVASMDRYVISSLAELDGDVDIADIDFFASTCFNDWGNGEIYDVESYASTSRNADISKTLDTSCAPPASYGKESYGVDVKSNYRDKNSFWSKLFGKKQKAEYLNASAYAPSEIQPSKDFIVRVFIHKDDESPAIDSLVKSIDKDAVKKAFKSLDFPIKHGDKISIMLNMSDGVRIDEAQQSFVWKGKYIDSDFICRLSDRKRSSISGRVIIAVNNVPCGDLKFVIDVDDNFSGNRYANVESRRFSKIFISYAHADYAQVRGIAEGCRLNGSDYFFDRHTLKAGDIFKDKILEYIDNADLFVLCWSKNAAESEWVQIERRHALSLIENGKDSLSIYPLSMPPEAPLPDDMSTKYNFASL